MSKNKKTGNDYIQMPLSVFIKAFPEIVWTLPPFIADMAKFDKNYIVRIKDGTFEFGYPGDKWRIG